MANKDLLFRFLGDTKSLERATSTAERSLGGLEGRSGRTGVAMGGLKSAAVALGSVLAVGQLAKGVGAAIGHASDYQESLNAVKVATGGASAEIIKLGDTSAKQLGLSKTAVNEAAVAFSAFGESIDAGNVAGVFEEYVTRATDFASVMNIDVQEALTKFRSGLAGESEPLRAYGIDVSAAAVKTYAFANGIGVAGKELTEAEKVQARYGLIMQETTKFAGDFANTSGGLANQQRILAASWEDTQAVLGEKLLPAMTELVTLTAQAAGAVPAVVTNFGLGVQAIDRMSSKIGDLFRPITRMDQAWTDADEALYDFSTTLNHARDRLAEGADATQVAAEWMGHLAKEGSLTEDTFGRVQEAMGLSNTEMWTARDVAFEYADQLGLTRRELTTLDNVTRDYTFSTMPEVTSAQREYALSAERVDKTMRGAAEATDDMADAVVNVADGMKKMTDPVYAAERAVGAYEQALEDANEDGVVTADEALNITQRFGDMQTAIDDLSPGNMLALRDQMVAAMGITERQAQSLIDQMLLINNVKINPGIADLDAFVRRVEAVAGKQITFDFRNLQFATQGQIERQITYALQKLARQGVYIPI